MKQEVKILIAKELKKLRIDNNLTLKELANNVNVGKDTLCRYESGIKTMNFDVVEKILNYYKIDVLYFFTKIYDKMQNKD